MIEDRGNCASATYLSNYSAQAQESRTVTHQLPSNVTVRSDVELYMDGTFLW